MASASRVVVGQRRAVAKRTRIIITQSTFYVRQNSAAALLLIRSAANSQPYTNRIKGPNVAAEILPAKNRPFTEDSKWRDKRGIAPTIRNRDRSPSSMK